MTLIHQPEAQSTAEIEPTHGLETKAVGALDLPHDPFDASSNNPIRVLVVDDDADMRAICRRFLERVGYRVDESGDGFDALARLASDSPAPDVIIMDVEMPNLSGLECTRRIKADPATHNIPIIMASARSRHAAVVAGLHAGADEYITKPFWPEELTLRVGTIARLHRSRRALMRSNEVRGEQSRSLGILFDLSCRLATSDHAEAILENIVWATEELTGCRRISVMLPDEKRQHLVIAKAIGIDEQEAAGVRVPIGGAIAGQVFDSGEPVVVNSIREVTHHHPRYDSAFFVSLPFLSRVLSATDQTVGVLNITGRPDGRPFSAEELEYVNLLCNIAAAALADLLSRQACDQARDSIVVALATLAEFRDTDTGGHLERVTQFALILADELGRTPAFADRIDERFLADLRRAMPLHDIGKVAVPDAILLKPDKLTPAEFAVMQRHAELGAETIRSVIDRAGDAHFLSMAEEIAHAHHEWFNGAGYPRGLRGDAISLCARIAAVADVYDALTTKRPYKKAFSHGKAVEIIREGDGTQFDPALVKAFLDRQQDFAQFAARNAASETQSSRTADGPSAGGLPLAGAGCVCTSTQT